MSDLQTFQILFWFTKTAENYLFFQEFFLNVNFLFCPALTFQPINIKKF